MFGVMCLVAYLPRLFWKSLTKTDSFSDLLVELQNSYDDDALEKEDARIMTIARTFHDALTIYRKGNNSSSWRCFEKLGPFRPFSRYFSTFFVSWYFVTKLFFIATGFFNLWLLKILIAFSKDSFYDVYKDIFLNAATGEYDNTSLYFPLITLCINNNHRVLASTNTYASHCLIQQNLYNRSLLALLTCCSVLSILVCTFGLLRWVRWICFSSSRIRLVKNLLGGNNSIRLRSADKNMKNDFDKFVLNYLKFDGVFIINMMAMDSGSSYISRMVWNLWVEFRRTSEVNDSGLEMFC